MRALTAVVLATLLALTGSAGDLRRTIDMAEFGPVRLVGPAGAAAGFAIAFSDAGGVAESDRAAMQTLGAAGLAVAMVDTGEALRRLSQPNPGACVDLLGPLEWLSSNVERDLGWDRYRPPLLLGRGAGGSLSFAALAQAPQQAFAGGVSVDFRPQLALRAPLCRLPTRIARGGRLLSPDAPLAARWLVGSTSVLAPAAKAFATAARGAADVPAPAVLTPGPLADVYGRAAASLRAAPAADRFASVGDLPLVEVSATTRVDTLAVIYSGDGGWRDIDKQLGDILAARGMAVVGVDSLRYFWSAQTPAQVGADLARILTHYTTAWRVRHVVLIGYSFGADILPFAYNGLPATLRDRVSEISLLAPGRAADFEIRAAGWLGAGPSDDARPIPPETARIERTKLQCIFGTADAEDSLCTDPAAGGMEVIGRPGGHHFDKNYDALAQLVMKGVCRRGVACRM